MGAETCLTLLQDAPDDVYLAAMRRCKTIRTAMNELIPSGTECETVYTVAIIE